MSEGRRDLTIFSNGSRQKRKLKGVWDLAKDDKPHKREKEGHSLQLSASSIRTLSGSQCSTSLHPFQALGLSEHLEGLCASLGIRDPTPVQVCYPCMSADLLARKYFEYVRTQP
jgi:hypothetical protein